MRVRRPSASSVIASLALFFALGGTAIAAKHYLITSTSQIKPSVLKQLHGQEGLEWTRFGGHLMALVAWTRKDVRYVTYERAVSAGVSS